MDIDQDKQDKQKKQGSRMGSFGSALLGGGIVAVIGAILILTGAVKSSGGGSTTTTTVESTAAPVVSKSGEEGGRNTVDQIYKADGNGVAFIESQLEPEESTESFNPFGEEEAQGGGTATGSGIVIDDKGHILTNNHVIEGAKTIEVKLGESDHEYKAEVVGTDPGLRPGADQGERADERTRPADPGRLLEDGSRRPRGRDGSPFGLDRTVTSGIVSALQRQIEARTGPLDRQRDPDRRGDQPRHSGGPLINSAGRSDRHQLADRDRRLGKPTATSASASRSRSTPPK